MMCNLPDDLLWRIDGISAEDQERGRRLDGAPSPDAIIAALAQSVNTSMAADDVRLAVEEARARRNELRSVVQFRIEPELFDWFFNARTGYRAQFRAGCDRGLSFNAKAVEVVRSILDETLADPVAVRRLNSEFEDLGGTSVSKPSFIASLAGDLSKIWVCTVLIDRKGTQVDLPLGVTGPKIQVALDAFWPAISRDAAQAWLDVKGAFVGTDGPYQPKSPIERARQLCEHGTT